MLPHHITGFIDIAEKQGKKLIDIVFKDCHE